jgi:glycosyltransferase involved in cell wall biosynthesis
VLSVVVPVRNDPERLRACLGGLRASTLREHEVIVVDDASTDDTAEVAASLGARVIRQAERTGPAAARNRGVAEARADYVMFVDADVCVHPDTLARVMAGFAEDPRTDALFGSYDLTPGSPNFLSQYKNLFHHYVHQRAAVVASTFWSGCGAIRRGVFLEAGGFSAEYRRPAIEDIELGARLVRAGRRIVLRKDVQATHLKRWTLGGLLKADVWDRGVPWTELILREGRGLPNDLNLKTAERVSALLACAVVALALGALVGGPLPRAAWLGALAATLVVFVAWNHEFYGFFARARGLVFAARVIPLHVLYYLYSIAAFAIGVARHLARRRSGTGRPGEAPAR